MKRIISFLLAFSMIICCCSFAVFAEDNIDKADKTEYLFKEKMIEWFINRYTSYFPGINRELIENEILSYDEIYFHYTDEANTTYDWVLLKVDSLEPPWYGKEGLNIGSRAVYTYGMELFRYGYGIYDAKADTFFSISEYEQFDGLEEAVEELELGTALGDVDFDGKLTVLDATHIQKILVQIEIREMYSQDDDIINNGTSNPYFIADFDQDGYRTVLDATGIQKYLANLE